MDYKTEKCDVLVIGSGGAGLRAAIELHDNDVDVLVVGKCEKGDAHTILANGGINAALGTMDKEDTWQMHAADTIRDGGFINDPVAVTLLCKNAPKAIEELAGYGVDFQRESDKRITQRFFGAAKYRRACFVGDETGKAILDALVRQVEKRKIKFKNNVYIFSLLHSKGSVNGAIGLDIRNGEFIIFHSKKIILATGGHSRMYRRSSSRFWENNGDGIYLAYSLGAKFMDMEMFQFHPTGMLWPPEAEGTLVTESVRGEGGILTNAKGERFMSRYDPERMELSARDVVARAIYMEVHEGRGTKHHGVWLDISHRPKDYILQRLPRMYRQFKDFLDVDISKEKMEVGPTAHYSMGGIMIDHSTGKTGIPNLFAIGEVTSGTHGGNRLGGNSLAEIIVFGRLTGKTAAHEAKRSAFTGLDKKLIEKEIKSLLEITKNKNGKNPVSAKKEIQQVMWRYAGVVRKGKDLEKALKELEKFKKMELKTGTRLKMNEKLIAALDVKNMLPTCEMVVKSALYRKESRAAHYRTDFRKTLERYRLNVICIPAKKRIKITTRKIPMISKDIKILLKAESKQEVHLLE